MKKVRTWINGMLSAILGLIGYGCSGGSEEILCKYGVPYAELEVSGQVTNKEGEPLKDMQIVMHPKWINTLYTDSLGQFDTNNQYMDPFCKKLKIIVNDTSGVYASDSTVVAVTYSGGDGNWNFGRGEIHVDFQLRKE